jgi:CO/xanthine dehydrogenase FAD-binding subunit
MRTALTPLELLEPKSLPEALRMLRKSPHALPIAGCTDVFVGLNFGTEAGELYVNLWGLDELRGISGKKGGTLSIGALTTYSEMIESPLVRRHLPMMVEASRLVGGAQIQNRGTLGGNIANASPAGDTLPVLAVADAVVVLRNADRSRRVPFVDFYTGYRRTVRRPDELIVAVEIPPIEGRQWFRKVGTRAANAISKVVMAAVRSKRSRIAVGSVGPTVIRCARAEFVLAEGGTVTQAKQALMEEIQPIDDLRSTAEYRKRVAGNLLEQFWRDTDPTRRPPRG